MALGGGALQTAQGPSRCRSGNSAHARRSRQQLPIIRHCDPLGLLGIVVPVSPYRCLVSFSAFLRAWRMIGCGQAFLQQRQGSNGSAEMRKRKMAATVLVAVTISALGVAACIRLATLLVPALLAHADRPWFLPAVLFLSSLSTLSLVFFGKHRAQH